MSNKALRVYARDGLYIPIRRVTDDQYEKVQKKFEKDVYKDEKICDACDYYSERPSDVCDGCPNYEGKVKMHQIVERPNGKEYLRLPFGAREKVSKIFGELEVINKCPSRPMARPIKFLGKLRDDQKAAVKAMLQTEFGVLKSPPRTGKTVMSAYAACKIGEKVLILASQKDWLDNFYETFAGSDTQEPMTDVKAKRIGFPKTLEDFERMDVCLVTYQKFLNPKGKKLLTKISKMFGMLLIDEVQTVGAKQFAAVVSQIHARYKIGVSGTPERKDCVTGDTKVETPIGPVAIRDLKVGDLVSTTSGPVPIAETHVRPASSLVRVSYVGGYVDCTPDHKFWSCAQATWIKAIDLTAKDTLSILGDLKWATTRRQASILSVEALRAQDTYDITVPGPHSYFGATSGDSCLMHNCKEYIIYSLLGPVFYENKVEKLRPRLHYKATGFGGKMPQGWTYIVNKIEKDPARLKLIAKEAIKDMNAGHLVLVPFSRVPVITALTKAINQMVGKDVAASFYGGLKKDMRKTVIDRARNYKVKILVGNIRLLSTGINIPRASMFYQCTPASNIPRAEQKFARVLTPFDGKPEPGIKYFLDDVQVVKSCMRKEHWQCLVPRFRPKMTGEVRDVITAYLNGKAKNSRPSGSSSYGGYGGSL